MKKLVTLLASVMLVSMSINAQEQGKFYVGGYAGLSATGAGMAMTDGYDSLSGTSVQANLGYGISIGYFLTDRVKVGFGYEKSGNQTDNSTKNILDQFYGSFAYYKEIANGLYYVPEFQIGFANGNMQIDALSFPLSGMYLGLYLIQLEFKPTEHFSTAINLGYATFASVGGAINYQGDSISLNTTVFTAALGLSPSVTFKYYF